MPRQARTLGDQCIYHVMNRGQEGQKVFRGLHDYLAFLDMLMVAKQRYRVEVFAFCLLPDHFHLLVRPEKGANLSYCMQWLQTSYVRRCHDYYGLEGPLWQGRYKSCLVQENGCLLTMMRFIEGHPVRSGLAEQALDYVWSSHRENYWGNRRQKLDDLPVPLPTDWDERVDAEFEETVLRQLVLCSRRQLPFGLAEWQKSKCRELGIETGFHSRGRPPKIAAAKATSALALCAVLLLPVGARAAEPLTGWSVTRISSADQAAVLTAPDGRLRLVRVGDAVGPTARIVAVTGDGLVLEQAGPQGPARIVKGVSPSPGPGRGKPQDEKVRPGMNKGT